MYMDPSFSPGPCHKFGAAQGTGDESEDVPWQTCRLVTLTPCGPLSVWPVQKGTKGFGCGGEPGVPDGPFPPLSILFLGGKSENGHVCLSRTCHLGDFGQILGPGIGSNCGSKPMVPFLGQVHRPNSAGRIKFSAFQPKPRA